jgi:hypothetical protein
VGGFDSWDPDYYFLSMRDSQREQWESDPDRSLVQSEAWNRATLICSVAFPLIVAVLVIGFVPDWNWRGLTAMMMLGFGPSCIVQILGAVYERIKYRSR